VHGRYAQYFNARRPQGFGEEKKNYAASYRSVQEEIRGQLPETVGALSPDNHRGTIVEGHPDLSAFSHLVCWLCYFCFQA
jgi:hypothetical protein